MGERILRIPEGRGRSCKRMMRRKRERRTRGTANFSPVKFAPHSTGQELRPSFAPATLGLRRVENADWMAQRMRIKRMPSSMEEKAQSSIEPKAMGVKIMRRMRMDLMTMSIIMIAQSSKLKAQRKTKYSIVQSSKLNAKKTKNKVQN